MFKTIFVKLVAIFLLVLIIAFSITGITLNLFLGKYVSDEKAASLQESSDTVNSVVGAYLNNPTSIYADTYLSEFLKTYGDYTSSMIWIVDQTGHIWKSSYSMPVSINELYTDDTGFLKLPDNRQYKSLMDNTSSIKIIGDFYGFFDTSEFKDVFGGTEWLTVAKSYEYSQKDGSIVRIAIYLHTPLPETVRVRGEIFRLFIFSVIFAAIVSIIFIYIFSLKLTRPLKQINNAAKTVAAGGFSKRLNISAKDEIGELADTFNQMVSSLSTLEESRRAFIANISHELRTPITSIRGFIDAILDGTIPPEKQHYYMNVVKEETIRINKLVNNLLDLSRLESGETPLNKKSIDIIELTKRCIVKLEPLIVDKNLSVNADFEDVAVFANADYEAIERVLYNLLHNAIKFTPEEGTITISVSVQKDKVFVSVRDTGIGIERDDLEHIWERFYKSDKSRSFDKTSTGLGLAIVRSIISDHSQEIKVVSEPGKGTEFTFTLDRANAS